MCRWMYYTGSACAHRPEANPDGTPRPFDESRFMAHGMWRVATCRLYWARSANDPSAVPCPVARKPDYYAMTRNMLDPGYELVENGFFPDGRPDYRCPRCRGVEPQGNGQMPTRSPRMPDWNAR